MQASSDPPPQWKIFGEQNIRLSCHGGISKKLSIGNTKLSGRSRIGKNVTTVECTEVNKINEEKIDNVLTANIYSICFEYYEIDEDYAHSIALVYSDLMECIDPSSGLQVKQRKPNFETISFSLYHTTPAVQYY